MDGRPRTQWPAIVTPAAGPCPTSVRTYRTLAARPDAAYRARRFTGEKVLKWGLEALKDTAELLVSELVTNAVAAVGGLDEPVTQPLRVRLSSDGRRLLVEVWDASPEPPVVKYEEMEAEHGRGLLLVETLAERWGWYWAKAASGGTHCRGGKVVWCEVA